MEKVIPVILIFFLGFALKKIRALSKDDGNFMLKIFFYVSIPALIFSSVAGMTFTHDLLWLPLIAALIILVNYGVAHACGSRFKLDRSAFGVFLLGSLIMNTGFTLPFILATTGEEGLARAALFDFGNNFLIFTFIYYLASRYGANSDNWAVMLGKFLVSPPLLALLAGLFFNLAHLQIPGIAAKILGMLGYMSIPLVMLTLGIHFTPKSYKMAPVLAAVFIRMAVGLLLGLVFVALFRLEGLSKAVVLVCASAPCGMTTLVFSSMEGLDNEFAASVVSYSTAISLVMIPLLLQLYGGLM